MTYDRLKKTEDFDDVIVSIQQKSARSTKQERLFLRESYFYSAQRERCIVFIPEFLFSVA